MATRDKGKGKGKGKGKKVAADYDTTRFLSKQHEDYFRDIVVKQSIIRERGIDSRSPEFEQIREKGWSLVCTKEGTFSRDLVQEFYSNARSFEGDEKTYCSYVRGHEISFSRRTINSIWKNPLTYNPRAKCKFQKICQRKPSKEQMWNVLCTRGAYWVESGHNEPPRQMRKKDLNPTAKMWCTFVSCSLLPTGNTSEVDLKRGWMIMALIQGQFIDFGDIVSTRMAKIVEGGRRNDNIFSLAYPLLITDLCRRACIDLSNIILYELMPPVISDSSHIEEEEIGPEAPEHWCAACEHDHSLIAPLLARYHQFAEARAVHQSEILQDAINDARKYGIRDGALAARADIPQQYMQPFPFAAVLQELHPSLCGHETATTSQPPRQRRSERSQRISEHTLTSRPSNSVEVETCSDSG